MLTFEEIKANSIKVAQAIKSGEIVPPNNLSELSNLAIKLNWSKEEEEIMRQGLFPTSEENAALSAKFLRN